MNEVSFLASEDPQDFLRYVNRLSMRRAWLLFVALGRFDLTQAPPTDDVEQLQKRARQRHKLDTLVQMADGKAGTREVFQAWRPEQAFPGQDVTVASPVEHIRSYVIGGGDWNPGCASAVASIFRDMLGNVFRFNKLRTSGGSVGGQGLEDLDWVSPWLTPDVLSLAQATYEEPLTEKCDEGTVSTGALDPLRLSILADALEEAGCDDVYLLASLRGEDPCVTCLHNAHFEFAKHPKPCVGLGHYPIGHHGWVRHERPRYPGFWALDEIRGVEAVSSARTLVWR